MPIIENTKGAATVDVAGGTYTFSQDEHGRFTAVVTNMIAVQCFLGASDRYQVVPEHPLELDESKPAKAITPAGGKAAAKTGDTTEPTAPKKLTAKQAKAIAEAEAKALADAEALKKAEEEAAADAGNGNENAGSGDGSTENQKQGD